MKDLYTLLHVFEERKKPKYFPPGNLPLESKTISIDLWRTDPQMGCHVFIQTAVQLDICFDTSTSPYSKKGHRSIIVSVEKAFFLLVSQSLKLSPFISVKKKETINILCLLHVSPAVLYTLHLYPQTPPLKTKTLI